MVRSDGRLRFYAIAKIVGIDRESLKKIYITILTYKKCVLRLRLNKQEDCKNVSIGVGCHVPDSLV